MKKFVLLCAVVSLALGVSFAQSEALKSSDQVSASVTRAHLPADGIRLGPNPVCLTATHPDGTVFYHECSPNTWTNAGYDAMIAQIGSTGSQPAAFTYLALSSDATAPAKTDTVLASEITTNGLARHVATYAHSAGTQTFTESYTWTATGSVSNVQKCGLLNASSAGTLGFENTFSPVSLNTNDQLALTWTISGS